MSSEAIAWAFKQDIKPSGLKFTLVAMAECANYKTGLIFASIAHLCEITGQDRKTILANQAELEKRGLIVDTGERTGKTKQVKVYRPNLGISSNHGAEIHYTYRLSDSEGNYYVGVRTCVGSAEADPYMGSGVWPRSCKAKGVTLHKEVLGTFSSRSEAEIAEAFAIKNAIGDPRCMNIEYKDTQKGIPETVLFEQKSTVSTRKQYQKRDTEPSKEPSKEPSIPSETTSPSVTRAKSDDDCEEVVSSWNAMASAHDLPTCRKLTGNRRKACQARLREDGLQAIQQAIQRIPQSTFLLGQTGNWSGANITFLLRPDSVTKILEGQYDDRQRQPQSHSERRSVREIGEDLARELIGAAGAGDSPTHLLPSPCEARRNDRW